MSLTRRDLIQSGLLLPALASFNSASAVTAATRATIQVIDDQLPCAAAIAAEARARAIAVYRFSSDPGRIWMNELAPSLRTSAVAISGYTTAATLFCLHYLARDYGLELAAIGTGRSAPEPMRIDDKQPIDLHDPRFRKAGTAQSWLMLPRRA